MTKILYFFLNLFFIVFLFSATAGANSWDPPIGSNPQFVMIGDSITSGAPADPPGYATPYPEQFAALPPTATFLNKGVGGETSSQIMARWDTDVVANHPRYVCIMMGVNDLNQGMTEANFLDNYTAALNSAVANRIIPVVIAMTPWTGGTNQQNTDRDTWNSDLHGLIRISYPTAIWVDCNSTLGVHRAPPGFGGGPTPPEGNLWDINWSYGTWVHFNSAGYGIIAQAVHDAIMQSITDTTPPAPPTELSVN